MFHCGPNDKNVQVFKDNIFQSKLHIEILNVCIGTITSGNLDSLSIFPFFVSLTLQTLLSFNIMKTFALSYIHVTMYLQTYAC